MFEFLIFHKSTYMKAVLAFLRLQIQTSLTQKVMVKTDIRETNPQLDDILDLPVDLDLAHVIESWMYKNPQILNQEHFNEDLQYLLTNYNTTIEFNKAL